MQPHNTKIYSIGDSAITIELSDTIELEVHQKIMAMHRWLSNQQFSFIQDIIIGYNSLSVFFNVTAIKQQYGKKTAAVDFVKKLLLETVTQSPVMVHEVKANTIRIPVCYDPSFGFDLQLMADTKKILLEEIIRLHTAKNYRVYMIGFLPGFPYMATVDPMLATPRKMQPHKLVPAGSVGIAGNQTGIYSLDSPGGWNIIGRTPVSMFNLFKPNPSFLKPGDEIAFYPISKNAFEQLQQQHANPSTL